MNVVAYTYFLQTKEIPLVSSKENLLPCLFVLIFIATLSGMSSEGIDLMEKYVDLTSDVQTAAITAVFTGMIPAAKDERVNSWICK